MTTDNFDNFDNFNNADDSKWRYDKDTTVAYGKLNIKAPTLINRIAEVLAASALDGRPPGFRGLSHAE